METGNTDSSEEARALGARVTGARTTKGLSVAQLADPAGVSKACKHQIENGACERPSAQVVFGILNVLGTSVGYLPGRTPDVPEPGKVRIPVSLRRFAEAQPELREKTSICVLGSAIGVISQRRRKTGSISGNRSRGR